MFEMMEPVRQMTLLEPCWRELLFLRTTCADEDNIVSELDLCSCDGRVLSKAVRTVCRHRLVIATVVSVDEHGPTPCSQEGEACLQAMPIFEPYYH